MKPIVRSALFGLALALLVPFTALAADGDSADAALAVVSQEEVAITPLAATLADPSADQVSAWPVSPAWATDKLTTSFLGCQGPPPLSCQCNGGFGGPGGSEPCCSCNTCWDGYVLALCELDP